MDGGSMVESGDSEVTRRSALGWLSWWFGRHLMLLGAFSALLFVSWLLMSNGYESLGRTLALIAGILLILVSAVFYIMSLLPSQRPEVGNGADEDDESNGR